MTAPTPVTNPPEPPIENLTAEEVARHYRAAMDSVNLINGGKPADVSDEDWADCLKRNKDHLKFMLGKSFWTTEDLEPIRQASA